MMLTVRSMLDENKMAAVYSSQHLAWQKGNLLRQPNEAITNKFSHSSARQFGTSEASLQNATRIRFERHGNGN
uniref:Uncharacterized protein n=1 Tax=Anopheles atroparvus TaxID=41427 RepID=A0AAG5D073_ANOAO